MQHPRRWRVALVLLPVALLLGGVALYIAGNLYFSTSRAIEANWGISVPEGLRQVEHHEEQSFHGDGYRFTVFEVLDTAQLQGTFFDVHEMSAAALTSEQSGLVSAITTTLRLKNPSAVQQSGLRKAERMRFDNQLLCLFDATSHRFYVYESMI